jgi:hypothetical protein
MREQAQSFAVRKVRGYFMNQPDLCRELCLVHGLAWRAGYDLGQCDLAKPADGAPVLRRSNMPGMRAATRLSRRSTP